MIEDMEGNNILKYGWKYGNGKVGNMQFNEKKGKTKRRYRHVHSIDHSRVYLCIEKGTNLRFWKSVLKSIHKVRILKRVC